MRPTLGNCDKCRQSRGTDEPRVRSVVICRLMLKLMRQPLTWLKKTPLILLVGAPSVFAAVVDLAPGDLYPATHSYSVASVSRTQAQYTGLYKDGRSDHTREVSVEETNANLTIFRAGNAGKSFFLSAGLPHLTIKDRKNRVQTSGIGDIQLGTGAWLFNDSETGQAAGIGVSATLPTGEYSPTQSINPGQNRRRYNVLARYRSPSLRAYWLDLMLQKNWLSDNTNFKGQTLSTTPSQSITAFVARRVHMHGLAFFGYEENWGAQTYINGRKIEDAQRESRLQVGWRTPISEDAELVIRAGRSIRVVTGYEQGYRVSLSVNRRL